MAPHTSPTPPSEERPIRTERVSAWHDRQLGRDIMVLSAFLSVVLHAAIAAPLVGVNFGPAQAHGFSELRRAGDVAPTELVVVKRVEPEPEVPIALPEPEPEPVPEEVGVAEPPPAVEERPPKPSRPARKAPRARTARATPPTPAAEPVADEGHAQRLGVPSDDADAPASDLDAAGSGAVDDGPSEQPPAPGAPTGVADGEGADVGPATPGVDIDALLRSYLARVARAVQRDFSYPRAAVRAGLEGQCVVVVTIDAEGRIVRTELDGTSGHSVLDRAALAAATSIKRVPKAPLELGWTERQVKIPFTFRLRG